MSNYYVRRVAELKAKITEIQLGGIDLLTDRDRLEAENKRLRAGINCACTLFRNWYDHGKPDGMTGGGVAYEMVSVIRQATAEAKKGGE